MNETLARNAHPNPSDHFRPDKNENLFEEPEVIASRGLRPIFSPKKNKLNLNFLSPRLVTSPEWMNRNVNHSDSSEQKKLKRNPPIWIFIRCKWVGFCVWPRPDHDPCKWSGASYANEPSYANILQPLGLKVDSINAKYVQHVEFCWFKKSEN